MTREELHQALAELRFTLAGFFGEVEEDGSCASDEIDEYLAVIDDAFVAALKVLSDD